MPAGKVMSGASGAKPRAQPEAEEPPSEAAEVLGGCRLGAPWAVGTGALMPARTMREGAWGWQ